MAGAFAVSMPVSAENTTISTDSYTLVIPTSATVSDADGFNTLGVTVKNCDLHVDKVTVTATSGNEWKLVSGENNVTYGLYNDNDSTDTATAHEFSDYNKITDSDGETWNCGIKLTGYSDSTPTGEYTDTITWTAAVATEDISFTYEGDAYNTLYGTLMTTFLTSQSVTYYYDTAGIYKITDNNEKSYLLIKSSGNWHVYYQDYKIEANAVYVWDTSGDTSGSTDTSVNGSGTESNLSNGSDTTSTGGTNEGDTTTGDNASDSSGTTENAGSTDTGAAGSTNVDGTTTD